MEFMCNCLPTFQSLQLLPCVHMCEEVVCQFVYSIMG